MNENQIWTFLKSKGFTDAGCAGIMGNLYAESALNPQNLQNSFEKKLGMTDVIYTTGVDNGTYTNFVKDGAGYGLAQWTYWNRKQNLLNFSKEKNSSIGSLTMQLDFLYIELTTSYPNLVKLLKSTNNVFEASNGMLLQFEKPANQGIEVQQTRAKYSQTYYDKFVKQEKVDKMGGNSSLVTYTKISPNKTVMSNKKIDTITIHCIVGQWTAKQGCDYFSQPSAKASANYVVGKDGSIGLCVEEKDRAWTSGGTLMVNGETGAGNDKHAVTIEVASDTTSPYAVTPQAYNALIKLCADICKRNNMGSLKWKGDKNLVGHPDKQNMTVHCWFANKSCPGDYLYSRMGDIANKANILNTSIEEDEDMTDERFAELMNNWLVKKASEKETWGTENLEWAKNNGIMSGGTNGAMMPNKFCTRLEVATMMRRLAEKLGLK